MNQKFKLNIKIFTFSNRLTFRVIDEDYNYHKNQQKLHFYQNLLKYFAIDLNTKISVKNLDKKFCDFY